MSQIQQTALLISASDFDNDSRLKRFHQSFLNSGIEVLTIAYGSKTSEDNTYLSAIPVRTLAARLIDVAKMLISRALPDRLFLKLLSNRLISRQLTQHCHSIAEQRAPNFAAVKHWTSLPTALLLKSSPKIWLDINEVFEAEHDNSYLWRLIYRPVIQRLMKISQPQIILRSATSAEQIKYMGDRDILHLPNTKKPITEMKDKKTPNTKIRLLYHGLITTNRSLETIVNALHRSKRKDIDLTIRGHGKPKYIASLKALVNALDLSEQVIFQPSIANSELIKVANDYDIGFCLFHNNSMQLMLAEPNKIYEYMSAGLGIIASETPTMKRMIEDKNIGKLLQIEENQTQVLTEVLTTLTREEILIWQNNSHQQSIDTWQQSYDWPQLDSFLKQIQLNKNFKP